MACISQLFNAITRMYSEDFQYTNVKSNILINFIVIHYHPIVHAPSGVTVQQPPLLYCDPHEADHMQYVI